MMKIILISFLNIMFMKNMHMLLIIMLLMMMFMISSNNMYIVYNELMMMDKLSLIMTMLTLISVMLIMLSSKNLNKISLTMIPISINLILTFMISKMMNFYILFELVLIPTMLLIMMEGKQPERIQASIYLLIYTITASLPLLISIIYMLNNYSFKMSMLLMYKFNMIMFLMMAFLVKMPMYFIHLWLPKAHVEAPLEGSMILAAVLLKLGGYGLIRFMPLCIHKIHKMNMWIISISIIGMTATGLNCMRQKDMKSLIAYSSVAHMGLVLMGIFSMNKIGLIGAIMMMIAHGLTSSALFFLVNDLYNKYSSRNIMSFKGINIMSPNINFWWFMFIAANISAPPTINTVSEILLLSSVIMWDLKLMIMLIMASLFTASFSMLLFINISHNKNEMLMSEDTLQKNYLSLLLHLTPLILFLMKMEMLL